MLDLLGDALGGVLVGGVLVAVVCVVRYFVVRKGKGHADDDDS
jgi:hypothetical protein